MLTIEHSFNAYGKVDTKIHFLCASEAVNFGTHFHEWNVKPVSEKDPKRGFILTIRRNP